MRPFQLVLLFGMGFGAGCLIAVQSVLNASLGERAGPFGSVLLLTLVSAVTLLLLILLFPRTAELGSAPGPERWYLYLGGVLGIAILAAPILLVPRLGTTLTLTAVVMGQLVMSLLVDHYGLFASPRIPMDLLRGLGVILLGVGAYLVGR